MTARATLTMAVALFACPFALGDGLPVLGVDVGSTGISEPDGSGRLVTIPAGPSTVLAKVAELGGRVRSSRLLPGNVTIPAVAYDATPGGLSGNGRTLVLITPRVAFPRSRTPLMVIETRRMRVVRRLTLRGDFSIDAVSFDGRTAYLIQYPYPKNPERYRVRALNLASGRLFRKPVLDPAKPNEKMNGAPVTRVSSSGGRFAYTLYGAEHPFIHALDTARRTARCIDLPVGTDAWTSHLVLDEQAATITVTRPNISPIVLGTGPSLTPKVPKA